MSNEEKEIKINELLQDTQLKCLKVDNVNHKPHPFMIGSKHLTRYFGVFAPHNADRSRLPPPIPIKVSFLPNTLPTRENATSADADDGEKPKASKPWRMLWAALLARVFAIDVLRCPKCGGRRVMISFITDPPVIHKILTHVNLPTEPPPIPPARSPPQQEMDFG